MYHKLVLLTLIIGFCLSCSNEEDVPHLIADSGPTEDSIPNNRSLEDANTRSSELGTTVSPTQTCRLGTIENCSHCGHVCPPGADTKSTIRLCLTNKCMIQCSDEFYDINSNLEDGCEFQDDLPIHDTKTAAADLGYADHISRLKYLARLNRLGGL